MKRLCTTSKHQHFQLYNAYYGIHIMQNYFEINNAHIHIIQQSIHMHKGQLP